MRNALFPATLALTAFLGTPGSSNAQGLLELTPLAEITAQAQNPSLGVAVAIDGSLCAVSDSEGRVHLYDLVSGTPSLIDTLYGPDGAAFGASLDLLDGVLVVGAPLAGPTRAGAVFVYRAENQGRWATQQMLTGPAPDAHFGQSVNLHYARLAVGAPGNASLAGAVHIYDPNGVYFALTQVLLSSGTAPGDSFGESLAWEGNLMAVGAPYADIGFFDAGAVYAFREGGVMLFEEARLTPSDPTEHGIFGTSVATDGFGIAVGAPGARMNLLRTGKAYVFASGIAGWGLLGSLAPELARPRDFYGVTVVMRPGLIAVGSLGDDTPQGSGTGSITFFNDDSGAWLRSLAIVPEQAQPESWSGAAMHINERALIVAAPGQNGAAGSAFVFAARDRVGNPFCGPAVDHSGGIDAQIFAYGSVQRDAGRLGLKATDLPAATFGVFLVSDQTGLLPGFMGGQGTLCLASPFGLFIDQVHKGGAQGVIQAEVDWDAVPFFVSGMVGQTYSFQAWFRDRNPGPTTNFSDAVSIPLQ